MAGLGFSKQQPPPPPPPQNETWEQFQARKQREAYEQELEWRRRQEALRRQRDQDPFGDVDMDQRGNPRWRYQQPGVTPRVTGEALNALDAVPGPQRDLTGIYGMATTPPPGGGAPPYIVGPRGRQWRTPQPGETPPPRGGGARATANANYRDQMDSNLSDEERALRDRLNRQSDAEKMRRKGVGYGSNGRGNATTEAQAQVRQAQMQRNALIDRLQQLRREYDDVGRRQPTGSLPRDGSFRQRQIFDEINRLSKQIDDIDRFLRGR